MSIFGIFGVFDGKFMMLSLFWYEVMAIELLALSVIVSRFFIFRLFPT